MLVENLMTMVTPILWLFIPLLWTSKFLVIGAYAKALCTIIMVFVIQFVCGVYLNGESVFEASIFAFVIAIGALVMAIFGAYIRKEQSE